MQQTVWLTADSTVNKGMQLTHGEVVGVAQALQLSVGFCSRKLLESKGSLGVIKSSSWQADLDDDGSRRRCRCLSMQNISRMLLCHLRNSSSSFIGPM